jgi:hypothetical protein
MVVFCIKRREAGELEEFDSVFEFPLIVTPAPVVTAETVMHGVVEELVDRLLEIV